MYTVITVHSYLRQNDAFVSLESFKGKLPDVDYIEGAIELTVSGKRLITTEMWDYVDQLWAYLLEGIDRLKNGEAFTTYFPDQPIEVTFLPVSGNRVEVSVVADTPNSIVTDKDNFVAAIEFAAKLFFTELAKISPSIVHKHQGLFHRHGFV